MLCSQLQKRPIRHQTQQGRSSDRMCRRTWNLGTCVSPCTLLAPVRLSSKITCDSISPIYRFAQTLTFILVCFLLRFSLPRLRAVLSSGFIPCHPDICARSYAPFIPASRKSVPAFTGLSVSLPSFLKAATSKKLTEHLSCCQLAKSLILHIVT
jgi:hypothetical protein